MLLLLQLIFKMLTVGCVKIDQSRLFLGILNLSHASTGRLQNHFARAVAVLRENHTGKAAAIPTFLADLNKQYDAFL